MILRRAQLLGRSASDLVDLKIEQGFISAIERAGHLPSTKEHEEVDLDGRVLSSGFWDEHVHMGMWAEYRRSIPLGKAQSARQAAEMMAAGQADFPDPIVVGVGYTAGLWPDKQSREVLDELSGSRPWILWSIDVHSCWLNSAAVETLGLTHVDESGVLRELEAFGLAAKLADVDQIVRDGWISEAIDEAISRGVVGVVDLDLDDTVANWQRRRPEGSSFALRVEAGVYPSHFDQAIERGLRTGAPIAPGVTVGPLKVITDGSLNTRTAFCVQPYRGVQPDEFGAMNYPETELRALMAAAKTHGFIPAFHAIGDAANRIIIDLFEQVQVTGRIEHAQLLRPEDFGRIASLGITASVQPQHAVDDREVADHYWSDRKERVIALRSMVDAGVSLAFGSDAPVSPLEPLRQIAAAVTRTDDDREPWQPTERITATEAFEASTRHGVEVGAPADLVALGADPLWLERAMAPTPSALYDALVAIPVELTIVDGRVQHDSMR